MRLAPSFFTNLLVFLTLSTHIPGASAASLQLTRRKTGEDHSHVVKRLLADFSAPVSQKPRARSTGIGRRGIVKGTYHPARKRVRRQEHASTGLGSSRAAASSTTGGEAGGAATSAALSTTLSSPISSAASSSGRVSASSAGLSESADTAITTGVSSLFEQQGGESSSEASAPSSVSVTSSGTSSASGATSAAAGGGSSVLSSDTSDSSPQGASNTGTLPQETTSASRGGATAVQSGTGSMASSQATRVSSSASLSSTSAATSTGDTSTSGTVNATTPGDAAAISSGASSSGTQSGGSATVSQTKWAQPSDADGSLTPVMSQGDAIVYTIDVTVGDGSVTVPVLVDTGSADMWVAGSNCDNCTSAGMVDSGLTATNDCQKQEKGYGSGSVEGCLVPTNVKFGNSYELEQFPILVASDSEGFDGSYMSGIFGLAMNQSSINNQAMPLNMMSQLGMISTPEVGFYLDRADTGSEIIFGSPHDDAHADQSKKVTLPKFTQEDGLYRVTMDGFVSHGYMVSSTESNVTMENLQVILDTGTSDIRVPEAMMLPLYAALGNGTFFTDTTTGDLVVPCEGQGDEDAALALQFGGQQFYVKWEDIVANPSSTDANYCYCRVQASPSSIGDYLIVGSAFFHNVYHVINTDTGDTTMYGLAQDS
ncbi:hypothetical protein IAR50_007174 [Cryptococcus sp. DSM 104548]